MEALAAMSDLALDSNFSPIHVQVSWYSQGLKTSSLSIDEDSVLLLQKLELQLHVRGGGDLCQVFLSPPWSFLIYTRARTHTHAHLHACAHTHTQTHAHTRIYIYKHVLTQTHTHTHTHTYIYIYIFSYTH